MDLRDRYHSKRPRGKVIMQNGPNDNSIAILDADGDDVTIDVLGDSHQTLLLLFPDLPQVGVINSYTLNELNDAAFATGTDVIGLTPATAEEIAQWQDISMASYPIYNMDDSELKMVARGNPAVVYLEDGAIVWKRTLSSLDGKTMPDHFGELSDDYDPDAIMTALMLAFFAGLMGLLLLNRSHLVIKHLFFRKKKAKNDPPTTYDI